MVNHRSDALDRFLGKRVRVHFKFGWPDEEGVLHYNGMMGLYELIRPGRSYAFRKSYADEIELIGEPSPTEGAGA